MLPFPAQRTQELTCYSPVSSVATWSLDIELHEGRRRTLIEERRRGELITQQMERKFSVHCARVELVSSRDQGDDSVKFGEPIMLFGEAVKGFLSVDLDSQLHHINERFGVSATP